VTDSEALWSTIAGLFGLAAFAGGSLLTNLPRVNADLEVALESLRDRRTAVLGGSVLSATGAGLLLWPIAAVATGGTGGAWPSLALFSVAIAALTLSFTVVVAILTVALVWRDPTAVPHPVASLVLDGLHLAIWPVSGPLAAVMVCATTAVGLQNDLVGPLVVVAAALKVCTVVLEVVGLGTRTGWNAGGWAAGSSGYATVAWFAFLIAALA
jgi:hypothetical protein